MVYYAIKIVISALVIVAVSEIAKRSTWMAALLASLPLTSLLAFIWLYWETGDTARIARLSLDILWLVVPSLALFIALPLALRAGWNFWLSLLGASLITAACYAVVLPASRYMSWSE